MPKFINTSSKYSKKSPSAAKRGTRKSSKTVAVTNMTAEQKMDFVGGLIAVFGLLSLVAFFARDNGSVTRWVAQTIGQIAGWGGFIIPVGMTIGGLYLLLRKVDRLPRLSAGRLAGVLLLLLNLLVWLHFKIGRASCRERV